MIFQDGLQAFRLMKAFRLSRPLGRPQNKQTLTTRVREHICRLYRCTVAT